MADVGISIRPQDTVLGAPPDVNANSMLVFPVQMIAGQQVPEGSVALAENIPHLITSYDEIKGYAFDDERLKALVRRFYSPTPTVDNTGTKLWLVPHSVDDDSILSLADSVLAFVKSTVVNGFENRPRNLMFFSQVSVTLGATVPIVSVIKEVNRAIELLYQNGFACVALVQNGPTYRTYFEMVISFGRFFLTNPTPYVGYVPLQYDPDSGDWALTAVGGYMASLPVGTSIGDASLPPFANELYLSVGNALSCSAIDNTIAQTLGSEQLIFARTRPPRNGLWLNDGATLNDPANALSTLEAGRTMAAMVDDLRAFFTPYLNNKIPVNNDGDIQSTYKQVVLDNARDSVINRYIESGDISDARITLKAKDNDMIGTRQWEVTLSILPAPTLRWIDGFVFYVNSL